jgi:hypothetical protein
VRPGDNPKTYSANHIGDVSGGKYGYPGAPNTCKSRGAQPRTLNNEIRMQAPAGRISPVLLDMRGGKLRIGDRASSTKPDLQNRRLYSHLGRTTSTTPCHRLFLSSLRTDRIPAVASPQVLSHGRGANTLCRPRTRVKHSRRHVPITPYADPQGRTLDCALTR